MTVEMCKLSKDAFGKALGLLDKYDEKGAEEVSELESHIDNYEDQLGTYMVKLSKTGVSEQTSKEIAKILHTIDDFERIGDHAENLVGVAAEMYEKKISFSHEAKAEIGKLIDALREIVDITSQAFETNDLKLAASVEPLEQVIDKLKLKIKANHIQRLQSGDCSMEMGFILSDLLTNFERVADHCSNIAVCMIELAHGSFDTHEYLNNVKTSGDDVFVSMYNEYKQKYVI
jgi:phosphate:Na+ symporter